MPVNVSSVVAPILHVPVTMRVLVLLTLAAVFATAALGLMAPATQEQAKALRDNWKNCSQVVRGRLGALASETAPTEGLRIVAMNNTDVEVIATPRASPRRIRSSRTSSSP
jgi:hypothetical protein